MNDCQQGSFRVVVVIVAVVVVVVVVVGGGGGGGGGRRGGEKQKKWNRMKRGTYVGYFSQPFHERDCYRH